MYDKLYIYVYIYICQRYAEFQRVVLESFQNEGNYRTTHDEVWSLFINIIHSKFR